MTAEEIVTKLKSVIRAINTYGEDGEDGDTPAPTRIRRAAREAAEAEDDPAPPRRGRRPAAEVEDDPAPPRRGRRPAAPAEDSPPPRRGRRPAAESILDTIKMVGKQLIDDGKHDDVATLLDEFQCQTLVEVGECNAEDQKAFLEELNKLLKD